MNKPTTYKKEDEMSAHTRTIRRYDHDSNWYCVYDGDQHVACVDGEENGRVMLIAPQMLDLLEGMAHCDNPATIILHYEDDIHAILRAVEG